MSRCSSCGASVVWVRTRAGKKMPCDPELFSVVPGEGTVTVVTVDGETVRGERIFGSLEPGAALERQPGPVVLGRISHFATCSNAARHRRCAKAADDG